MTQPEDDGVRDIGTPFRLFTSDNPTELFDVDFHPQAVSVRDVHPSEFAPKAEESSSATESAEGSLTPEQSQSPDTPANPAPVEKEQVPGLEDLDSPEQTSDGSATPPVVTPPSPPAPTRSSRNAGK